MTQEQFNQDYGRIAMPKPFAHDGLITPIVDIGDSTHPVNFADGFPSEYSAPHSQGGKYVTRGEFNAIGNLATRNDFYKACGGLNTFNAALASKIGGYPKGAVLQLLDNNVLKYVISLVDNNTVNFNTAGVDGVNWMFCYESKHEEVSKGFLEHIELEDIPVDQTTSTNVYMGLMPANGFFNIRNVKFTLGESLNSINGPIISKFFVGAGIVCKSVEDPSTITPWNCYDSSVADWRSPRTLFVGNVSAEWVDAKYYASDFFGAFWSPSDISHVAAPGSVGVIKDHYAVIDIVNGISSFSKPSSGSSLTITSYRIASLSFDIYII